MIMELSAVRLIAPWFGTSLVVWSNVIAVVLLGLSLGYLTGARLSLRADPVAALRWVFAIGIVLVGVIPLLTPVVANFLTPEQVNLDQALELFQWGSLAASALLFLGPSIVLGCVGPLVTEALSRGADLHAGDAGGRVLFGSTLGSLVGVFGTSAYLIPVWGLRGTYVIAALALVCALAASFGAWRNAKSIVSAGPLGLALVGLLPLLGTGSAHASAAGFELLAVKESPYQRVRVVAGEGLRFLQVNEASNSFQSAWQPEPGLLAGNFYFNDFALPYWWQAESPKIWRVLCIGMGAGTAKRVLEGTLPTSVDLAFTGIELDPVVTELAKQWCELQADENDLLLSGLDGRAALRALEGPYDQIIVDAYANQFEIPAHLVTREFFAELERLLAPQGWVQLNVGGSEPTAPLPVAVAGTLNRALQSSVLTMQVPGTQNQIINLRRGGGLPDPTGPDFVPARMPEALQTLLRGRNVRGQWAWITLQGPVDVVLTDDRAPVEHLLFEDL
jgi:predicted membrane-bound spermidine synthase